MAALTAATERGDADATRKPSEVPRRLTALRERLEHWRASRNRGERIPDQLWESAAKFSGKYGVYKTARTLGLDYASLKKRAKPAPSVMPTPRKKRAARADFLELVPTSSGLSECTVELEDSRGSKMRIHIRGADGTTLGALARSFLRGIE